MHVLNSKIKISKTTNNNDGSIDFIDFEALSKCSFINQDRRNDKLDPELEKLEKNRENDSKLSKNVKKSFTCVNCQKTYSYKAQYLKHTSHCGTNLKASGKTKIDNDKIKYRCNGCG